jgi:hypothetical protein
MAKDDETGPTRQRVKHAGEYYHETGYSKSNKRYHVSDDQLGKALNSRLISPEECSALRKYSLHWLAGGLQGHLASVDLNRILAFDAGAMNGLAKTERQHYHRQLYWQAHEHIGERPAYVADQIACYETDIYQVGLNLGYQSRYRGREKVREILSDAGYRLGRFWHDMSRSG